MTPQPKPASSSKHTLLPGMAAISIWMLGLSVLGVVGVLTGHYRGASRIAALILCTIFAVAGLGLISMRRWGWALTMGAAFLSMGFGFFSLFHFHQAQWMVTGVINLVFFLYLARSEVIERLR